MAGNLTKLTVNLTQRANTSLEEVALLTGDSRTDSVNKALNVYFFLQQEQYAGKKVVIVAEDGTTEILRII